VGCNPGGKGGGNGAVLNRRAGQKNGGRKKDLRKGKRKKSEVQLAPKISERNKNKVTTNRGGKTTKKKIQKQNLVEEK